MTGEASLEEESQALTEEKRTSGMLRRAGSRFSFLWQDLLFKDHWTRSPTTQLYASFISELDVRMAWGKWHYRFVTWDACL